MGPARRSRRISLQDPRSYKEDVPELDSTTYHMSTSQASPPCPSQLPYARPSRPRKRTRSAKPRNPFIIFRSEFWRQLQEDPVAMKEQDSRNNRLVSIKAGKAWKQLSVEEKKPYVALAQQERQLHLEASADRRKTCSEDPRMSSQPNGTALAPQLQASSALSDDCEGNYVPTEAIPPLVLDNEETQMAYRDLPSYSFIDPQFGVKPRMGTVVYDSFLSGVDALGLPSEDRHSDPDASLDTDPLLFHEAFDFVHTSHLDLHNVHMYNYKL